MKLKAKPQPLAITTSYTPLVTRFGIVTEGGSRTQFYYTIDGSYIPSRAVTPLKLRAWLNVIDPDGVLGNGDKSSQLTVTWYEGSYSTQITASTSGYTLNSDGTLLVKKNVEPSNPIQVLVRATYKDTRNGNTLVYEDRITLNSVSKTDSSTTVRIDQPSKLTFDPMTDDELITINAELLLGNNVVGDANAKYWWYLVNNGVETLIDQLDTAIEYISGQGTKTLKVNAMYTNFSIIRVKAVYYTGTAPTSPASNAPYADVAIVYKLPMVRAEVYSPNGSTLRSTETSKTFVCRLRTNNRILTDAEVAEHYLIKWYKKPMVAGGTASHVSDGATISIKAADLKLTNRQAMNVYPEVYSRGAYGYVVDASGKAITNSAGKLILART